MVDRVFWLGFVGFALIFCGIGGSASSPRAQAPIAPAAPTESYADLADLADSTPLILKAEIRKIVPLDPLNSPELAPGQSRFFVEARTKLLLFGTSPIGESLRYLVDLPVDSRGKPPALKKKSVLLFAAPVAGQARDVQLVSRQAQILWSAEAESRLRVIIVELQTQGAPPKVTGIREAHHVAGALRGEGETQLFLNTANDSAASIQITRSADGALTWGASFSELTDGQTKPPRETLGWYRLACFLPPSLPRAVNLSQSAAERIAAERDYRQVMLELGPCRRNRK